MFDWHSGPIERTTPLSPTYRNTQAVRRFLRKECGETFTFDRPFMAWITSEIASDRGTTMGDVADEWMRRKSQSKPPGN